MRVVLSHCERLPPERRKLRAVRESRATTGQGSRAIHAAFHAVMPNLERTIRSKLLEGATTAAAHSVSGTAQGSERLAVEWFLACAQLARFGFPCLPKPSGSLSERERLMSMLRLVGLPHGLDGARRIRQHVPLHEVGRSGHQLPKSLPFWIHGRAATSQSLI